MKRFYLRLSWICKEKEQRMAIDKETKKQTTYMIRAPTGKSITPTLKN